MPLTKKDLKEIKSVVVEATEPYFTAIKEDFNNIDDRFDKIDDRFDKMDKNFIKNSEEHESINQKLDSLERRIIALEDISTEHGKELRKIKVILTQLKKQKKVDQEKVILLEKRVARVEAMVAV